MNKDTEYISIPKEKLIELLQNDFKLYCLENLGVDNWEWYGEAMCGVGGDDEFPGYENEVDEYVETAIKHFQNENPTKI